MHTPDPVALTEAPAITAFLASKITSIDRDEDDEWYWNVEMMLSDQSKETLDMLLADSSEFNQYHWGAVDNIISDFIYGGPVADNSWSWGEEGEPAVAQEFLLRVAFNLVPLVVEEHLPMLSTAPTSNWGGDYEDNGVGDMNQMISNAINYLAVDMTVNNRSIEFARGIHLYRAFCLEDKAQISDEAFLWMSDHAMLLLANADKVFADGGFDHGLAEELLRVETPVLRAGVL